MNPCAMPNLSFKTFAMGARQLVVQLALETILSFAGSKTSSLTPIQIVASGSLAGALISTRLAPAFKCSSALSRLVNNPVDSSTTSIPSSSHGRLALSLHVALPVMYNNGLAVCDGNGVCTAGQPDPAGD